MGTPSNFIKHRERESSHHKASLVINQDKLTKNLTHAHHRQLNSTLCTDFFISIAIHPEIYTHLQLISRDPESANTPGPSLVALQPTRKKLPYQ